jgi:hypothetical protein
MLLPAASLYPQRIYLPLSLLLVPSHVKGLLLAIVLNNFGAQVFLTVTPASCPFIGHQAESP